MVDYLPLGSLQFAKRSEMHNNLGNNSKTSIDSQALPEYKGITRNGSAPRGPVEASQMVKPPIPLGWIPDSGHGDSNKTRGCMMLERRIRSSKIVKLSL